MSVDLALVRLLETRMMNAWPARDTLFVDGWVVRATNAYSRRAQSASAVFPDRPLDDATLDAILALMARLGVRPCFRISPLAGDAADALLAARGFRRDVDTLALVAPRLQPSPLPPGVSARLDPVASAEWTAANAAAYGGEKANASELADILGRIRLPAAFATLSVAGEPVAWGMAVVQRDTVALQDLVVRPDRRGAGLGLGLVGALLDFGAREGASRAFLQVREENHPARALYAKLGFETAYAYHHRVA